MFRQHSFDVEKPEYRRCCGIHVRKLASFVAIIFLSLTIFSIPNTFFVASSSISWGIALAIQNVIAVTSFALVLLADKSQKPQYYLPCLFYLGLQFVLLLPLLLIVASGRVNALQLDFRRGDDCG
uniref:Uncharacterized protein n=1 Tax=Panagrolaimus sp. JU765 TaxID=591449 RepID=A0AC34QD99_9BILA